MYRVLSYRLSFYVICFLFRGSLDVGYVFLVSPVYSYAGFIYDFSFFSYFVSLVLFLLSLILTPHLLNKVSDFFLLSYFLMLIAPLSSLVGLGSFSLYPLTITVLVFMFFRIFQYGSFMSGVFPVLRIVKISEGKGASLLIALASVLLLVFWYFYSGAFNYFNLNILKIYEYRDASADLANVGFFSYFNGWVHNVFSIFLMCALLLKRKYLLLWGVFAIQVFFFGVSAHKSVLVYPVMVFGLWFYFNRTRAMSVIPLGFLIVVVSCLGLYLVFDYVIAGSIFIRRVFFVPAKLALDYFDFFSVNDFVWWSNSVFEGVLSYPYDLSVPRVIGQYNGSESAANNGFISSGYAHAGVLGVAVYSVVLAYFLKILDSAVLNSDVPIRFALCVTLVPLWSALISSDLFTTMLTHGLVLSFVMIMLFRGSPNFQIKSNSEDA